MFVGLALVATVVAQWLMQSQLQQLQGEPGAASPEPAEPAEAAEDEPGEA